jgi:hypothetical protein
MIVGMPGWGLVDPLHQLKLLSECWTDGVRHFAGSPMKR